MSELSKAEKELLQRDPAYGETAAGFAREIDPKQPGMSGQVEFPVPLIELLREARSMWVEDGSQLARKIDALLAAPVAELRAKMEGRAQTSGDLLRRCRRYVVRTWELNGQESELLPAGGVNLTEDIDAYLSEKP